MFLRDEVDRRRVGQVLLEGVDGLIDQRDAIREKEYTLCPVASHQQIAEGNDGTCLPGARGHDEQGFAVVVLLKSFGDPADSPRLVVATGDIRIDM